MASLPSPNSTLNVRLRPGVLPTAALSTCAAVAAWGVLVFAVMGGPGTDAAAPAGTPSAERSSAPAQSPTPPPPPQPPAASVKPAKAAAPVAAATRATGTAEVVAGAGEPLTNALLASLNCDRLWAVRQWVSARHGCDFTSPRAQAFFASQPGYTRQPGRTPAAVASLFTPIDRRNLNLVGQFEAIRRCKDSGAP